MSENDENISFGPNFMSDDIPMFQKEDESTDWKQKAEEETKKIDEKLTQEKEQKKNNVTSPGFMRLVSLLASQAYIFLGAVENPSTGTRTVNLDQARESIESLSALFEKSQGNLSDEEDKLIKQVISELQMIYVDATQGPSTAPDVNQAPPTP